MYENVLERRIVLERKNKYSRMYCKIENFKLTLGSLAAGVWKPSSEKFKVFAAKRPRLAKAITMASGMTGAFAVTMAARQLILATTGADILPFGPEQAFAAEVVPENEVSVQEPAVETPVQEVETVKETEPVVETPVEETTPEPKVEETVKEPAVETEPVQDDVQEDKNVTETEVDENVSTEESEVKDSVEENEVKTSIDEADLETEEATKEEELTKELENKEEQDIVSEEELTDEEMEEEIKKEEEKTEDTNAPVTKENELEITDAELHENPDMIEVPAKTEDKNGFAVIFDKINNVAAIFTPDDKFSYDELAKFIANFNETGLTEFKITDETTLQLLGINPDDVNGTVYYDLSEYGLGTLEISLSEDGTYVIVPDGTADIEVATGYMSHSYANDLDPDSPENTEEKAKEPTHEPTPDEPKKPEEPETPISPQEPEIPNTPDTPIPYQEPEVPEKEVPTLPQTGDAELDSMIMLLGGVAGLAGLSAAGAAHYNKVASTESTYRRR
ncbi:MAG: hypothetical protein HFH45_03690 [Bacilli bacterium]|nr:hypothetical protein [Bacilli bacterium]